ncbi:hypothetical protein [Membranihabitans maritimus]|uniref:gliding motility lipoprotein GldD n=1 Tax=Membranihabitans maritimus TaxID=2904244 RepID=UPI001F3ADA79|nr:hypothetical protein [Membranihabitans maritimus]
MFRYLTAAFLGIIMVTACADDDPAYSPKPRMYPRVEYPAHAYEWVEKPDCGFKFRKLASSTIESKERFFNEEIDSECWFNLVYPDFDATVYYTYYPIDNRKTYSSLVKESFRMAYEHSKMATSIQEEPLLGDRQNHVGMSFDLKGPVASPYQFFLSDTTNHFIRGSLYFNTRPNPDSLRPVLAYVREDLDTLIQSFTWY